MTPLDLEERLIDFSVKVIEIADNLAPSYSGNHLANQVIRSSTSTALNYGEARSAESNKDFIHKCQIILKELRETHISLRLIRKANLYEKIEILDETIKENNELISIFVATINKLKTKDL
jgi:four helix bundle protein